MQTQENRLRVIIPNDCAQEFFDLPPISKAMLVCELIDEVIDKVDGIPVLDLSATTTQWLKAVTLRESLQIIENLALMLMSEVKK
ncbi:MAG: hypothetical protein AUK48_02105 [Oscillatoriales cyanobacterium CG2_30_44_21]|nr:MAG: hypothetical protein AUK48_02105 [Oscillatoriales cyanobacterium CG2_30_44_21]